ncbi:protein REVEILLE 6-like [Oryza brachyantha]|uniref:protein REVEILLE 6-like n=1 Tax=Oryza brachyantha TaxID=4533 RepID=UPI0003EA8359|nr:protein REVEILLE 6-like [Oryza brachyantha]
MAAMAAPVLGKKTRKPYTITRPRERWSGEEHDRFLHALMLFGRDWKRIEGFVATKTATQIRSHAQKHFLKARKFGLAGGLPPPPLHPRRAALLPAKAVTADTISPWTPSAIAPPPWPPAGGAPPSSAVQRSMSDWSPACYAPEDPFRPLIHADDCSFIEAPNCSGSGEAWIADAAFLPDETILLPISPDDLGFAQVYKFVGDLFGSGEPRPVEAQLRRLQAMDPAISETILLVLRNLEANLLSG